MYTLPFRVSGTLGTSGGAASDGVLLGAITPAAVLAGLLKQHALTDGLCITNDGGTFVNESSAFQEATTDDVEIMLTAAGDANYFGHATKRPTALHLVISTQGVPDVDPAVIAWEYSKGAGVWGTLANVTDGTTAFTAATGTVAVTFDAPTDMAADTVLGVSGFWVRARMASGTAHATGCQLTQGYVIVSSADAAWTDDTIDLNDAGAGDVALLPAYPVVGDLFAFVMAEKFCKLKLTTSQARTGTATVTPKYWNGTTWATLTCIDDSVGYTATAGTHFLHFVPPTDWVANTAANGPNGQAGFAIVLELTAKTSVTAQPLATRAYALPLKTGASGFPAPKSGAFTRFDWNAGTISGTTADTTLLLVNVTLGTFVTLTITKGVAFGGAAISARHAMEHQYALVQVGEDGSTEFADLDLYLRAA